MKQEMMNKKMNLAQILVTVVFMFCVAISAQAATLLVTKTADTNDGVCDNDCSLREAIAAANSGDEISFAAPLFDLPQTIQLNDSANLGLLIDKNLTINGRGANLLTVRGATATANFRFSVFTINPGLSVLLKGLKITGGAPNSLNSDGGGGGVLTTGSATTVSDCYITDNFSFGGAGGGIRNVSGTLTVSGSTISGNSIDSGGGGGIDSDGALFITNSTVSGNLKSGGNSGTGGVWVTGTATITNSTITNNQTVGGGTSTGGIYNNGAVTLRNTLVAANVSLPDVGGANFVSEGYNLVGALGNVGGVNQIGDQTGTTSAPINPRLDALGNYGGTTPTHRLQVSPVFSPAIDKGKSFGWTIDQRGNIRPIDNLTSGNAPGGDASDIGAFETDAYITVTKIADTNDGVCDSDCSLREAISAAASGNTIIFSSLFDTAQTITLSEAAGFQTLSIADKSLSIAGRGAQLLTIRRSSSATANFGIFNINSNLSNLTIRVSLSGMTITGGKAFTSGAGGIRLQGSQNSLTVTDCIITGNSILNANVNTAGGIQSTGSLTISRSTVSNNTVSGGGGGTRAGGIYSLSTNGYFIMSDSTVSGNVISSVGLNNAGGLNAGDAIITNSTVTDNGISDTNGASGIYGNGNVIIRNTIIAGNRNNTTAPDVAGGFVSHDFNLVGNVGTATGFNQRSDQTGNASAPINPMLSPLALNGGTTPNHALLIGSPAIDAGYSYGTTTDQRGAVRPIDNPGAPSVPNGDNSDIGAFEAARFSPLVVTKTADTNDGVCNSDCSLREAIAASVRGTEITFSSLFDSAQTITLSEAAGFQELLIEDKSLSIAGKGVNLLTIRRDLASAASFRIFNLRSNISTTRLGLNLSGMTITGGKAGGVGGGGIRLSGSENSLTVTNCLITGNTVSSGGGGGIISTGWLRVFDSTVSNNTVSSGNGGGISAASSYFTMTNSTVSGNVAVGNGGGIYTADATITNSTVADNSGLSAGGVYGDVGTIIRSSIIAANRNNSTVPDVANGFISNGYNLIGNRGTVTAFNQPGDQTGNSASPINPLFDALGNYGGTTPTHRLQPNSTAIDKGNSFGSTTDQRGLLRPFNNPSIPSANGGDNSDIGAFEVQLTAGSVLVTKTADTNDGVCDSDCSLREAIAAAVSGNEVNFAAPLFSTPQTITLSGSFGELLINKNLTFNGTGAHLLTIRRDSASSAFRIFNISGTTNVVLNGMTISGGSNNGGGGGIYNNNSTVTVNDCHITNNFAGNSGGGGIYNFNGTFAINRSTVSANSSTGGGSILTSGGSLNIVNSTISGNSQTTGSGTGGIFASGGATTITNSTVTNNNSSGANSAGGIYQSNSATVTIRSSIVAGNQNNLTKPDVVGAFVSQGFNLIGNVGAATGFSANDQTGNSSALLDPQLETLALNGATTPTHGLISNSPAIDKGKSFGVTTDQRGQIRPFDRTNIPAAIGGDNSDIGAFEAQNLANIAPQISASPNPVTANYNTSVSINLQAVDANIDMPLTFTITDQTDHGTISGFNPSPNCTIVQNSSNCAQTVTYTPNQNYSGTDSFSVKANDGQIDSSVLTVNITVQFPANSKVVTKTADTNDGVCDSDCSLREAIATVSGGGEISFAASVFSTPQTITLSGNSGFGQLSINKNLTVNGTGANLLTVRRDSASPAFRIFNINGAANVILNEMTVTGGNENGGGGILQDNSGSLTINGCHITDNSAAFFGGGIQNVNGTLNINNSTISANKVNQIRGGAMYISGGAVSITNSTVSGNTDNATGNIAGGIWATSGTTLITNSTITNNNANGIYQDAQAIITLRNTIVAANQQNSTKPDVVGTFVSNGYNLIGNVGTANGFGANDLTGTSAAILDPKLSVLGNFGGSTPTHAVFSNSPAVNTADLSNPLTFDQRGIERTIGGRADIGAFENNFTFSNNPNGAGGNGMLLNASTGVFYSVQFSAIRLDVASLANKSEAVNLAPLTFEIIAGTLPPGIIFDANTGALSGIPTSGGIYNFTIKVTDLADGSGGAQSYVLNVMGPTSATVSISGRVLAEDGAGIRNARVILTGTNGISQTAKTTAFGYYRFDNVEVGETYVISVASKRFTFNSQIITVNDEIGNLDFIAVAVNN